MTTKRPSFCTKTKRKFSQSSKANTSLTTTMPPKKDERMSEDEDVEVQISFKDLEKSMITFTGDDTYPVETFIEDFEDTAQLMKWTKIEKLIYTKRLLDGTAKLFLRSLGRVKDYVTLKKALKDEFGPKVNSAIVHKKLAARKMKSDETLQQYFLSMKELALHGKVEDAALIEYVIDGIRDLETNKVILYGASDLKEFRRKLDIYGDFRKKVTSKPAQVGHSSAHRPSSKNMPPARRCFNCGALDHQSPSCSKGIKCFKCNEFGHKITDCTNDQPTKTMNIQYKNKEDDVCPQIKDDKEKVPYKKISINGKEFTCLIDTGSDVNLIIKSEFEKIKGSIKEYKAKSVWLTGIAENRVDTEGIFTAEVEIERCYTDMKFHVVKDHDIPVTILIGNPILNDYEVHFTPEGVNMKKLKHPTLIVEENDANHKYDIEDSKNAEEINKMCKKYNPNEQKKTSKVELRIVLDDEDPVFQSPRRLSPLKMGIVNKQIEEWLAKGVIRPSQFDFARPIVLAHKKDGSRRMCIDYRKLNKKVIKEILPLPIIKKHHVREYFGVSKTEELINRKKEKNIQMFKKIRLKVRNKAKESIKKIQEEDSRGYDKNRKEAVVYNIGDLVAIKKIQISQGSKLFPKFLGPYEVTAKKRNDRYAVKKVGYGEGPINTSTTADMMKPWTAPEEESSSEADE